MVSQDVWFPVLTTLAGVVVGGFLNGYIADRREQRLRMRSEQKAILQASLEMLRITRELLLSAQRAARKDGALREDGNWLTDDFATTRYMPALYNLRSLGEGMAQDDVFAAKNRIIALIISIPEAKTVDDVRAILTDVDREVSSIERIVMAPRQAKNYWHFPSRNHR